MFHILKFVKNHGPYSPGDVAGFNDIVARDLLAVGTAELAAPEPVADIAPQAPGTGDAVQFLQAARRGRPAKS